MSVNLKINGIDVVAEEGATVLEAAKSVGIKIPTLCFMENCNKVAACRMCVVEVKGMKNYMPSCVTKVREGMEVITESEDLLETRRRNMDLIFKHHNTKCEYCSRYADCELHEVLRYLGMSEHPYEKGIKAEPDISTKAIVRDNTKCITCRRCVSTCSKIQGMNVLKAFNSAGKTYIGTEGSMLESGCTLCGACLMACPTGALSEFTTSPDVSFILRNKKGKRVVAVVAEEAAKRVGELFYEKDPAASEKKLITALKLIGFDAVYKKETYSKAHYCPSVRNMAKQKFPELVDKLFDQETMRPYEAIRRAEENSYVVAITPCIAEKGEENIADYILTTRGVAALFRHQCVSRFTANELWKDMEPGSYDCLENIAINLKENNRNSVYGLKNVEQALNEVREGLLDLDSIELYACPKGCMYGSGQPRR